MQGNKGIGVRKYILFGTVLACGLLAGARTHAASINLDDLRAEVDFRLGSTNGTNNAELTKQQRRTLTAVHRTLHRNVRTLAAEATQLASASMAISRVYTNDPAFQYNEEQAAAMYSDRAHLEVYTLASLPGTNALPKGASNQLDRVRALLATADATSNSVPVRARALSQAFTKLQTTGAQLRKKYNPQAPASVAGTAITLSETARINSRTTFYFHTTADFYSYTSDNPEELGTWTYERLTSTTGVLHCHPDFPDNFRTPHDMALTFTSPNTGTFSGQNAASETITGTFVITH